MTLGGHWSSVMLMRSGTPKSCGKRAVEAFLALLIYGLLAPGDAHAGCVSHATSRSQRDGFAVLVDPLVVAGAEVDQSPQEPDTTTERQQPCSGPSCSGKPAPLSIPSISLTRSVEQWASFGTADLPAGQDSTADVKPMDDLVTRHSGSSIFHPPRGVACPSPI
jgi:hypothetical protein